MAPHTSPPWHSFSLEDIAKRIQTDPAHGLDPTLVLEHRTRYGANAFSKAVRETFFQRLFKQFKNPLVSMLLIGVFATLIFKEYLDMIVILAALLINVVISLFQESRAGKAFEKLVASQEHFAEAIRSGERHRIPAAELVVGDVIFLETGTRVPADARIIEERDLGLDESVLTGEWIEAEKDAGTLAADLHITERKNMVWMGSLVVSGNGRAVVVAVGNKTELGGIASGLATLEDGDTPLQKSMHRLAKTLAIVAGIATLIIFALGIFREHDIAEMILVAVSVGVAAMPEGLPVAVTVTLIIGMEAILKRGGLVRNLLAAETLGSTTIILTDKTGTLTKAAMEVAETISLETLRTKTGTAKHDSEILSMAVLAADAFVEGLEKPLGEWTVHGRPVERAILRAGIDSGADLQALLASSPRIDFLAFQSERRFGASLNKGHGAKMRHLFVNGAPELLLASATHVHEGGKRVRMTKALREQFAQAIKQRSTLGMRLIAVAYKNVGWEHLPHETAPDLESEVLSGLTLGGIIVLHDPIRPDVRAAIDTARKAGTRVIMLTGDNRETALAIAREAGIAHEHDRAITGTDIEAMSDEELLKALMTTPVFARVLPHQKLRIAKVLKRAGEVVAMTGDGVNDAPALRAADIGIALGSGTEVAKEASDLVLIDGSFSVIVSAIEEGRRILDNLKKIVTYLVSTSMSEVFLVGGALVVGAPLPILPSQIIWTKIVEEGFMNFAFAFEPKEDDLMRRDPKKASMRTIVTGKIRKLIMVISLTTGVLLIGLYFFLRSLGLPIEEVRTLMFVAISVDSILFAIALKNLHKPIWRIPIFSNRYLVLSLSGSILALVLALTTPWLQKLLSVVPLTWGDLPIIAVIVTINLAIVEAAKYVAFRHDRAERARPPQAQIPARVRPLVR